MIFGYIRCSKYEQCSDRQLDALLRYGVPEDNIYQEKITGTIKNRPELDILRKILRNGDILVIESLSRLGRSTKNLLEFLDEFENKGIVLVSLKENIDMSTPTGKLLITVLSAISQFERDIIVQRTQEGLSSARARGRKGGRPPANKQSIETAITLYNSKQYTVQEICNRTGISKSTLYKTLKGDSK